MCEYGREQVRVFPKSTTFAPSKNIYALVSAIAPAPSIFRLQNVAPYAIIHHSV